MPTQEVALTHYFADLTDPRIDRTKRFNQACTSCWKHHSFAFWAYNSNCLADPGVISDQGGKFASLGKEQLKFL
jgi:hypothetical protein